MTARGWVGLVTLLLPLQMGFAPDFNFPPRILFTGVGLDTAYSMPASDELEGEWLLGIRAFSTRFHVDAPAELAWYGGSAELMRGFSSEAFRLGGAVHGGWAFFGAEAGAFTWLGDGTDGSGILAGVGVTVGFATLYVRQTLAVHGLGHFTQFGLRVNAPFHADRQH